jgi:benzoylformate decarboxylase
MDRLAERHERDAPWPSFQVDIAGMARAQGCEADRISEQDRLLRTLDEVIPHLASRRKPLLLDVAIAPTVTLAP